MKTKRFAFILAVFTAFMSVMPTSAFATETTTVQEETTVAATQEETTDSSSETTTQSAADIAEKKKELKQQKKELEESLAEAESKLAELEKSSKVTEEYIDTLDQKIGYINEQLTVLEEENTKIQSEIDELTEEIEKNEAKLETLSAEVEKVQSELDELEEKFQSIYEAYCYRLKVMYISGEFNIISALLSCKDLSGFFTRYQMIKSVSKSDAELLAEVQEQMEVITTKKNGLNEKKAEYESAKAELDEQKAELEEKQNTIENNSEQIAQKKASLATDRAESDKLLAELTSQNKQYTEFRNEDSELIEAVESEIQDLISGLKTADKVTTAVASDDTKSSKSKIKTQTDSDVYSKSDAVLNMTYPVPSSHSISAGFPNYSSGSYHGGIDFPCSTGSKVVAAQKGIVITVKRLSYSYGYYVMIYHGTDKSGRSVVTLYAHNSSVLVSVGDTVQKGETIAKSGSTGNSTGPHCHFEVRLDGTRVNPKNYLSR
ncbi:MAG: peptidoglycan DD-metalloendopeptidase family protein [Clostridiales bacterium]|nr:peptidoglycan DD-metalloendopeptidase family protein [Clostridiales bacterium]